MTSLYEFLSSSIATDLAQSLLHSLWQALIIALLLLFALKGISGSHSRLRYRLALLSIVAVVLSWIGTYSILRHEASPNMVPTRQQNRTVQSSIQTETAKQISNPARQTPASTAVQTIPIPPAPKPKPNGLGYGWLISAWFIGVVLMTVRIFIAMAGASRHKRKATPIEDPALVTLLKNLCTRMDVKRKIRFAATHTLNHPSVIGFWKPMLLIPASMLTGTPLSDLEAIVAHELAHVRRNDYLINLGQMILESIFFFNPTVWWISRQIRIEREACCDLLGINATGRRADYAKVLVDEFARTSSLSHSEQPAIAMGFGNDNQTSTERIRRIIHPRQKPTMKIGSVRLALLIGIATLALVALSKTADLTVEAAAKILTPKERVEKLIKIARETEAEQKNNLGGYSYPEVTVSGVVKTIDGAPLPKLTQIDMLSYQPKGQTSGYYGRRVDKQGHFKETIPYLGTLIVCAYADGYAPTFSKPISTRKDESIENIELTLGSGFPLVLHIIDSTGNPIPEAKATAIYTHRVKDRTRYLNQDSTESDSNGVAQFEHATEHTMLMSVEADGFPPVDNWACETRRGEPLTITMKKGLVATGGVVDKENGEPIPNAKFRLMFRQKPKHNWDYGNDGKAVGQTDAQGRFTFNDLSPDTTYTYIVEAEGYNRVRLEKVDSETMPRLIEMIPELYIRGTVIGDLRKLGKISNYGQRFDKGFSYLSYMLKDGKLNYSRVDEGVVEVKIKNGVGHFELRNIVGDQITLRSSDSTTRAIIMMTGGSVDDTVINMDTGVIARNTPHREVAFIFKTPPGFPTPEGMIQVWHTTEKRRTEGGNSWLGMDIHVTNGVGRASFNAPGYVRLGSTAGLKGYWAEPDESHSNSGRAIQPGSAPCEFTYEAQPAGGISGKLLNAEEKLEREMRLQIHLVIRQGESNEQLLRLSSAFRGRNTVMKSGLFSYTSLPLDQTYVIIATSGDTMGISDAIRLDERNPIQEITIRVPKPTTLSGRVLKLDGTPSANLDIHIKNEIAMGDFKTSYGLSSTTTDKDGTFLFEGIITHPTFTYFVQSSPGDGIAPISQKINPGEAVDLQLKKGLTFKGRIIDHESGWPVVGANVHAISYPDHDNYLPCDAPTDDEGRFTISTLGEGTYGIDMSGVTLIEPAISNLIFTAGVDEFIELRVTLRPESKAIVQKPKAKP